MAYGEAFAGSGRVSPAARPFENDLVGAACTHHAHPDGGSQDHLPTCTDWCAVPPPRRSGRRRTTAHGSRPPTSQTSHPRLVGPRPWPELVDCELHCPPHAYIRVTRPHATTGYIVSWTGETHRGPDAGVVPE